MSHPLQPSDRVTVARDIEATQIPFGVKVPLAKGTTAIVTQTLGGNITLNAPSIGLIQIAARDASALTREGEAPAEPSSVPTDSPVPSPQSPIATGPVNENAVWETLKTCFDPEIPVNIVDLGLIYDMKISPMPSGNSRVDVKMTLTARGCGMGPHIAGDAAAKLRDLPGVADANVEVVWDPPWNPEMISEEGRRRLGIA